MKNIDLSGYGISSNPSHEVDPSDDKIKHFCSLENQSPGSIFRTNGQAGNEIVYLKENKEGIGRLEGNANNMDL